MTSLLQVVFYSLIGGVFSLVGGIILLSSKRTAGAIATYATPFAAGALLSAAFLDLLQEAIHQGEAGNALTASLVGILFFFLLERFLHWFHHHHDDEADSHTDPTATLVIVGDTVHNFIDGIAIASGFLVSPATGIIVTVAVAAHEIPQEIGDFGLLLSKGLSKRSVLIVNVISALATTVAAVLFYQLGNSIALPLDIILGLVAGLFIYIAVSDIIPTIHKQENETIAGPQTLLLIFGLVFVGFVNTTLHRYIDIPGETEPHSHQHDHS